MLRSIVLVLTLVICLVSLSAQGVSVNETGAVPDASAILDISHDTKGVLIPRMTSTERTAIASPAEGLLVFDMDTGSFWYYFGMGGGQWIDLGPDHDWYKVGGTEAAKNINDNIYHMGNVGIGKSQADHALDILANDTIGINLINNIMPMNSDTASGLFLGMTGDGTGTHLGSFHHISGTGNGKKFGALQQIDNSGDGAQYGYYSTISGSGSGIHHGAYHRISGAGGGTQYGSRQFITQSGDGNHYGVSNVLNGAGTGRHYGSFNSLSGAGSGFQYGTRNEVSNSGDNTHSGVFNLMDGSGTGIHYGTYNIMSGSGMGEQYASYNRIVNSGDNFHYGNYNELTGDGAGFQYGTANVMMGNGAGIHTGLYNAMGGSGEGVQYGVFQQIANSGDANHYGVSSVMTGIGAGAHYATYNLVDGPGTGVHYGTYQSISSSGDLERYGTYNVLSAPGTGDRYGFYAYLLGSGTGDTYGTYQKLTASAGTKYGSYTEIEADNGTTKVGTYTSITGEGNQYGAQHEITATGLGPSVGVKNILTGDSNGNQIGIRNEINNSGHGFHYGVRNQLNSGNLNAIDFGTYNNVNADYSLASYGTFNLIDGFGQGVQYGTYNSVITSGFGTNYAGYFHAPGGSNDFAAVFNAGNVVANEIGGDYDFRIESDDESHMFFLDANHDRIGIGTQAPIYRLDVEADNTSSVARFVNNDQTTSDGVLIRIGPTINPTGSNDFLAFQDGNGTALGSVCGDGAGGVNYASVSDRRLKQNIRPYVNGLKTLIQMQPRLYEMKSCPGKDQVGFLAQELFTVLPSVVSGTPESPVEDPMMVDYGKITPVLVSAIQEQQVLIEQLTLKITALEAELKVQSRKH